VLVAVIDITRAPSQPRAVDGDGEDVDGLADVDVAEELAAAAGCVGFSPARATERLPRPPVQPERTSVMTTSATLTVTRRLRRPARCG
jgi:hypothetical protein